MSGIMSLDRSRRGMAGKRPLPVEFGLTFAGFLVHSGGYWRGYPGLERGNLGKQPDFSTGAALILEEEE